MSLLDKQFDELLEKVKQKDYLNPAHSDPIFYFVYPPSEMLEIKKHFTRWGGRLQEAGFALQRISFLDLLWQCVDESGRWNDWVESEPNYKPKQLKAAISDSLNAGDRLVAKLKNIVEEAPANSVVFLTETEALHPYFRTRTIESALHDKIRIPTVIFYPGTRSGQYGLKFLGFYPEDSNYRSVMIGGV